MSRPAHRALLLATLATSAVACGLFASSVEPGALPDAHESGVDAHGSGVDAGEAGVDAARARDGGRDAPDAVVDASRSDATLTDAGASDALTDVVTPDAGASEASVGDAGRDAGRAPGFCESAAQAAPPMMDFFCQDFDEDGGLPGVSVIHPPGTLSVESLVSKSPPNALAVATTSADGGQTGVYLQRGIPVQPASSYSFEFELAVMALPYTTGTTEVFSVSFGTGTSTSILTVNLEGVPDGGSSGTLVVGELDPGGSFFGHAGIPVTFGSGFTHIRLQFSNDGAGWADVVTIGTAVKETRTLGGTFSNAGSPATFQLGLPNVSARGARSVYIDNLLITAN